MYMEKKEKKMFMEMICLYNCFTHVYTIVLHIVFDIYGKESKANVYGNDMFIQLFYTLYLIYMKKKVKKMFMERICLYNCFIRCI